MAAFPAPPAAPGSLHEMRDFLLDDLKELAALAAAITVYVKKIEEQRVLPHTFDDGSPATDADYDAAVLPVATSLHVALDATALLSAIKTIIDVS